MQDDDIDYCFVIWAVSHLRPCTRLHSVSICFSCLTWTYVQEVSYELMTRMEIVCIVADCLCAVMLSL